MKKPYAPLAYEVTEFFVNPSGILTLSSDRENAYVPSDSIWKDWGDIDFDDDD